jgi:hypothetical protein
VLLLLIHPAPHSMHCCCHSLLSAACSCCRPGDAKPAGKRSKAGSKADEQQALQQQEELEGGERQQQEEEQQQQEQQAAASKSVPAQKSVPKAFQVRACPCAALRCDASRCRECVPPLSMCSFH